MKWWYTLLTFLLCACSASRLVKPLPEKKLGISCNMGGPLIKFGSATIPIPLSSVSAAYGLKNHTTVFGSLHTTALLFGVGFIDLGMTRSLVKPKGCIPGFSVSPMINLSTDFRKFNSKLWPQLDLNAYWDYGKSKNHFFYLGFNNWFELARKLPDTEQKQEHHWFLSPQIGNTFVTPKWRYTLEMKWSAANVNSSYNVGNYIGIKEKGALGVYVSIMRYF